MTQSGDYFEICIDLGPDLPGNAGDPVYATATVDSQGTNGPAAYLTWAAYASGQSQYPVTLNPITDLAANPITTTLDQVLNTQVDTKLTRGNPPQVTSATQAAVPETEPATTSTQTPAGGTTLCLQSALTGIENWTVLGGAGTDGTGNAFPGGTVVTAVNGAQITTSKGSLVAITSGTPIHFQGSQQVTKLKLANVTDDMVGWSLSGAPGGMNPFAPNTKITAINGNDVTFSPATMNVAIPKGTGVVLAGPFNGNLKTIQVADHAGIETGMLVAGGSQSGSAFSAETAVAKTPTTNTVTLTEGPTEQLLADAAVKFRAPATNQVKVANTAGIVAGMGIFGGTAAPGGNAFQPDAIVTHVDTSQSMITFAPASSVLALSNNSTLTFTPLLPAVQIGTIGQANQLTLQIPADQDLSGGRIIFTPGGKGGFSVNQANKPIAPVPYAGSTHNRIYDFVEFAWTAATSNFNFDTSIVDQFGLSITINFKGKSLLRGCPRPRNVVMKQYETWMRTAQFPSRAASQFFQQLATLMSPYRILAPADAFLLADNQGASAANTVVKGMHTYFDALIKRFFDTYDRTISGQEKVSFTMQNVSGVGGSGKNGTGFHDLSGYVTKVKTTGTDGQTHHYRALQLEDTTPDSSGKGWIYHIFEPFFNSNGYASYPPPPQWLNKGQVNGQYIPLTTKPTEMVFGASGVFADSGTGSQCQPTPSGAIEKPYQTLLGAIENQMVTAINRGIVMAPQWRWLHQAPNNSAAQTPQVTVVANSGTLKIDGWYPIYQGMSASGSGLAENTADDPNIVTDVQSTYTNGAWSMTLTLSKNNLVSTDTDHVVVSFNYQHIDNPFYQQQDPMSQAPFKGQSFHNGGIWNYFSQFFHLPYAFNGPGVSLGGLAYAYAFDDQGNFSTDISAGSATEPAPAAVIQLGQIITA